MSMRRRAAGLQPPSALRRLLQDHVRPDCGVDLRTVQARCADLQAQVDRQAALLHEMNHRLANSLAIAGSLLRLQSKEISDEAARSALLDTENRLAAIMHLHRSLSASDGHERTEIAAYFRSLISGLERSLLATSHGPRLRLETISIHVPTARVSPLGMIVCELVTNAVKYAYPVGTQPGEVRVLLHRSSDGAALRVAVEDDGVGFAPGMPTRLGGIGRRVIDAMVLSLGGRMTVDMAHRGARVTVEFPI